MSQHKHLYNSAAWKKAREAQLRQHPLCRMHMEQGRTVLAAVVDHIVAHRGDRNLFSDRGNLQSLCKACHDRHKQAQEHSPDGLVRGAGLSGKPLDLSHPWHKSAQVGGVEKSNTELLKTGPQSSCATPRNG